LRWIELGPTAAGGNCFDCHGEDATGNPPIGSTN
jgi:hypothetical protein